MMPSFSKSQFLVLFVLVSFSTLGLGGESNEKTLAAAPQDPKDPSMTMMMPMDGKMAMPMDGKMNMSMPGYDANAPKGTQLKDTTGTNTTATPPAKAGGSSTGSTSSSTTNTSSKTLAASKSASPERTSFSAAVLCAAALVSLGVSSCVIA